MRKKIVVLGASGSVGLQTLDVIAQHHDQFECIGLSVYSNWEKIKPVLDQSDSLLVSVHSKELASTLSKLYPQHTWLVGEAGLSQIAATPQADMIVNAIVGYAGLLATIKALEASKKVALANKESLVVAGKLINQLIVKHGGSLIPIDSEHSGVYQCIHNSSSQLSRIIITASGGSLRDYSREDYPNVSVEQALAHPNWEMGAKITIDSASMVNKAFEVIEAHHLFNLAYDQIEVMMHPQSKVHALVEFEDHSFLAQLGAPDMKVAIAYALSEGKHMALNGETLDFTQAFSLDFKPLDSTRYPVFDVIVKAAQQDNSLIASLNGANEAVIEAFLSKKINFYQLETILMDVANTIDVFELNDLVDIKKADQLGRQAVAEALKGKS